MLGDRVALVQLVPQIRNDGGWVMALPDDSGGDVLALGINREVLASAPDQIGLAIHATLSKRRQVRHTYRKGTEVNTEAGEGP